MHFLANRPDRMGLNTYNCAYGASTQRSAYQPFTIFELFLTIYLGSGSANSINSARPSTRHPFIAEKTSEQGQLECPWPISDPAQSKQGGMIFLNISFMLFWTKPPCFGYVENWYSPVISARPSRWPPAWGTGSARGGRWRLVLIKSRHWDLPHYRSLVSDDFMKQI